MDYKIPKCSQTATGKHKWQTSYFGIIKKGSGWLRIILWEYGDEYGEVPMTPKCEYCNLIDDRKVKYGL